MNTSKIPKLSNNAQRLKREILVRLIKAFYSDNFEENARLIPYDMKPKGGEVDYRCCIYKERAALKNRTMAGLGVSLEDDTERTPISVYAVHAQIRRKPDTKALTVLESACQGCLPNTVFVTDLCQGCVARPCMSACKFSAISVINGKSSIDPLKCRQCGMCMKACPYQAIVRRIVPCENACPVGAITKGASGHAEIDFDRCITCGKCLSACPFGAVHEKSHIIDVLTRMKMGMTVIGMVAPAIMGKMSCTPGQLVTAMKSVGFEYVYEVAEGADVTTKNETAEFVERMERGDAFMTTSCCAAYNELIKKHLSEIKPFVSETKTPLYYTAEIVKKKFPNAVTVFISPCTAKRSEAAGNDNVNYVLSTEELTAMFIASEIEPSACEESEFEYRSSKQGRGFPIIGGVAQAVRECGGESCQKLIKPFLIDGITKQSVKDLKKYAKDGRCPDGNLIEVMSCQGGCIAENAVLIPSKTAIAKINTYSEKGIDINEGQGDGK